MAKFLSKPTIGKNGGDEGGEILLEKADTNTTIAGTGVTIDIWQNRLRFFEQGGDARGAYIDITSASAGVGSNLLAGGGGATTLDGLTDVTAPSPSSGDFLKWNGSAWVNDPINLGTDTTGDYVSSLVAGTNITLANNSGESATPTISLSSTLNNISVSTSSTTTVPLTIKQITSQSSSLVEFLDSSNNVMSKIDYVGTFWSQYSIVGNSSGYPSGTTFAVNSVGSSSVGIIAKGASGQTADLLQLQNSSGSILVSLSSDGSFTTTGALNVQQIREKVTDSSISTNVMTCDYTTGTVFYQSSNPSANFTVNVTNLPTDNGNVMTISIFVTQGATGYIPDALQVAGSAQTIKWAGGTAPTPTSSSGKIDLFTFSLIRRGSAWTVLGSANLNY
jgi:hypothetical protein